LLSAFRIDDCRAAPRRRDPDTEIEELEVRFRAAAIVVEFTHCQLVWISADGHTPARICDLMARAARGQVAPREGTFTLVVMLRRRFICWSHIRRGGHSGRRPQIIENIVVSSRVQRQSPCNGGVEQAGDQDADER
jgi:hypothetical protein